MPHASLLLAIELLVEVEKPTFHSCSIIIEIMKCENQHLTSPVWLLGDSPPTAHERHLDEPLDRRFPTRHNIWTPIESAMNRQLFVHGRSRIDDTKFYIRNAVASSATWVDEEKLNEEVMQLGVLIDLHRPLLILPLGQNAFELVRRARGGEAMPYKYWTVSRMLEQFDANHTTVRRDKVNVLPLLHAIVARQFHHCRKTYGGNYFDQVGCKIATIFEEHREDERLRELWMCSSASS